MYSCFHLVLLSLLWSLVEVHSQTFPYVSFMGQTSLANNSYVDISQVGRPDVSNYGVVGVGVQCVTDLATCCTSAQGSHRGDWYFPDGTRLPFAAFNVDTFGTRVFQGVELRRNSGTNSPTVGIYRCDIQTLAVHDDDDISVRDTVYVGLYTASGGVVSLSGGVAFDPSQLTLTCISTGGPATTVTWTRDSTTVTQGTVTVLNNSTTAQYTHTLTVTNAGEYTCTVANNKPSSDSASTTVTGTGPPTNVAARQTNPTSILVSWSPSSDATGYTISYTGGGSRSETVSGGDTNSYTLTGLTNGETYTISLVATSQHLFSDATSFEITLIPAPGQVFVSVSSITTTSISLSWSVSSGRVAGWKVVWRPTDRGTESTSGPLSGTTYTIHQLDPSTIYTLTVSATNVAGATDSTPILFSTGATDVCQAESTSCECDNTSAIIGGVVGVAFIIATSLTVIVVVILVLRSRSGNYSAKTRATVGATNQSVELSKISAVVYADLDQLQTTSNEAYNVVRGTGRTAEDDYEVPQNLPPPTTSQQPTPTTGDYEPV